MDDIRLDESFFIDLQWFAKAEDEGRTEEPSEHKLRKAREEGKLAKSAELNSALVLFAAVLTLILCAPWLISNCVEVLLFYFNRCTEADLQDANLASAFLFYFVKMILPITTVSVFTAVAANLIQNRGFLFTTKTIMPKFSKIVPNFGEYFRKTLFSFEGGFNVIKSLLKVALICIAAWILISSDIRRLLSLMNVGLWPAISHIASMAARILITASIIFLVISIPDYLVQRRQFRESQKMTKQEVKEEFKQMEGDPFVKNRLRQYMRELLAHNMPADVAKSDVVIANPTHYAVAVRYDKLTMHGPMVTAKGVDSVAQHIKRIAAEHDVPVIENRPLARALYAEVEIGDIIPENFYKALAEILAGVYAMKRRRWV